MNRFFLLIFLFLFGLCGKSGGLIKILMAEETFPVEGIPAIETIKILTVEEAKQIFTETQAEHKDSLYYFYAPPTSRSDSFLLKEVRNIPVKKDIEENFTENVKEGKGKQGILFRLNRITESEKRLLTETHKKLASSLFLIDAALIAEGVDSLEKRASYRQKYVEYQIQLKQQLNKQMDSIQKTRLVFEFMHNIILTGKYSLNNSSLAALFDSGVFNCVSATVLYNALAKEADLMVLALEKPGHAKSRVFYLNGFLDLETTCTKWELLPDRLRPLSSRYTLPPSYFEKKKSSSNNSPLTLPDPTISAVKFGLNSGSALNSNAVLKSQVKNESGDRQVVVDQNKDQNKEQDRNQGSGNTVTNKNFDTLVSSSTSSSDLTLEARAKKLVWSGRYIMREIDDIQLIATIYYNRGVDYYQEKRYNDALAVYLKAMCLDSGNNTILGNFKATLNNWAIQLAEENSFQDAIHLTEIGLLIDPDFIQYKENLPVFYQHWIAALESENRKEEADYLLKKFERLFPQYVQPQE